MLMSRRTWPFFLAVVSNLDDFVISKLLRNFIAQVWISMLIAFYVTLCEKTFQGSGLGGSCLPVSSDGKVTVMMKDPDVKVGHSCLSGWLHVGA